MSVTADSIRTGHSPSQVLRLLSDKPYIVSSGYVRSLMLLIGKITDQTRHWEEETSRLLPLLTNLESVRVMRRGVGTLSWTCLGRDFRRAFENVMRLSSIREVVLRHVRIPLEVLHKSSTLKRLRLSACKVDCCLEGQKVKHRACLSWPSVRTQNLSSIASWLDSPAGFMDAPRHSCVCLVRRNALAEGGRDQNNRRGRP